MKSIYEIIKKPIITEKSEKAADQLLQYTFEVDKKANKIEIRKAIEEIFKVNVIQIRTIIVSPKSKRVGKYEGFKPSYKKAIVRLAPGQTISSFEV